MKRIWEFFESFGEAVYVTDIETDELVYINANLRKVLGFHCADDYKGKKCHEVLQGYDTHCGFCTNAKLTPGEFVTWSHQNPLFHRNFLVKDTVIEEEGHRYRVEIAIDINKETLEKNSYYMRNEIILNECMRQIFSTTDPSESIEKILAYIGTTFQCDRCYVFEIQNELMTNTYEWCSQNVIPQKDILCEEPLEGIDWWMELFQKQELVIIEDLEDIRNKHPITYGILKPQSISSLAVGPIGTEEQILGFIGVDNPNVDMLPMLKPLLHILGYFMVSLLKRRDLFSRLQRLSFHDALTGAYNRNAMMEHTPKWQALRSIGVAYCDITSLKQVNDSIGHHAGDDLICQCYHLIQKAMDTEWIYRTGGDEFVVICPNCGQDEFKERVHTLRYLTHQSNFHIAVGESWSNYYPVDLEDLILKADQIMYEDKREYYTQRQGIIGVDRRCPVGKFSASGQKRSLFQNFISSTYCDMEAFFQAISVNNSSSYFFFGDMQKNVFYISDNLRDEFGFESNVLPNMVEQWRKRISTEKFQILYDQDIQAMLKQKRTTHNLRYQVRMANGKNIWVHCYSILKWNEEQTEPLFLSGRITRQDDEFVIDPVTNFPRSNAVFGHLVDMHLDKEACRIIGFSLNNIGEINNTRGYTYADRLLKKIAERLTNSLSDKMIFYRLEGARCMAMVDPRCTASTDALVKQIRSIIEQCYQAAGISIHNACSIGVMTYPHESLTPGAFIEAMVSLIKVAKHSPAQAYIEYSDSTTQHKKEMSEMALALGHDVTHGMEHFRIVIQPVVSAKTGQVIGGEVLLRWRFHEKDISPAIFIPMLEKSDLIHLVGRWVFDQAARNCIRAIAYIPQFYLTFNVSLRQLTDDRFTDIMKDTLEKYHLDGRHLIAEITESCLDEQPERVNHFIEMCSKMGIGLALDDFGSGYSSMQMLLRYSYHIVKLDRSLIRESNQSEKKRQFFRSIVYACHQFGQRVCVEGVETAEENTIAQNTGCDVIQGYYYHRPLEKAAFYQLLGEITAIPSAQPNEQ